MPKKVKASRLSPRLITGIVIGVLVALALFLRIYLPYKDIFVGEWVKFAGGDNYFYMRLVDYMTHNFPHLPLIDPYLSYPNGESIGAFYLFARILASASWLIGLGHPSQHLIDMVSVYIPPIMGALTIIPVYFIGKSLAGRWTGIIAASVVAVLPGEILGRSILGFTDHHVAEFFFSAVAMMFFILALKNAQGKKPNEVGIKPIVYSLLAGVSLGVYLLTWIGGLLFVFLMFLCLAIQLITDHMRHRPTGYLAAIGAITFSVAAILFLPAVRQPFYVVSILGINLLLLAIGCISWFMEKKNVKAVYYPLAVVGVGIVGMALFFILYPPLFDAMVGMIIPKGTQLTTIEMQPLLFPNGVFTFALAWGNFGLTFFMALIALGILVYKIIKQGDAVLTTIVVWSGVILVMTLGQRRFAYYLSVNVAILTGYLSWLVLKWAGLGEWKKARGKRIEILWGKIANTSIAGSMMGALIFAPIIPSTISTASHATYAPSNAWCESFDWLRNNSPEPFGDPNAYYNLSDNGTYGVMAWWDYGYWITRIAHRIPNSNPSQNPAQQIDAANFLVAQDESQEISQRLKSDYVMIDLDTVTGKFWAIATYAGKKLADYSDVFYVSNNNQIQAVQLYYPDYYRSLAVRLYNFDGKAVKEKNVIAMVYEERKTNDGKPFKFITDAQQFNSYEAAKAFITSKPNWVIVGNNPLVSPIPLDAVTDYELVYSSSQKRAITNVGDVSEVKIFRRK